MALSKHWLKHISAWQSSGLSQAAYCRQQGLNAKSFSGRLSEFRQQSQSLPSQLIPVKIIAQDQSAVPPVLVLSIQGSRLELPTTVSAQWLGDLLRCLS